MRYIHKLLTEQYHLPLVRFLREYAGKMGKNLVTIGWNNDIPSRDWISFFMADLGFERVMIVEAYRPNANAAFEHYRDNPNIDVIGTSIQEAVDNEAIWTPGYNACLWSHGYEHVSIDEHEILLPKLFNRLDKIFIGWAPWGNYYGEDANNSNPWQRHQILVPDIDFPKRFNLDYFTCDEKNSANALLVIHKWLREIENEA